MDRNASGITRRHFVGGLLGAGGAFLTALPAPAPGFTRVAHVAGVARRDFTTREAFDALDRDYRDGDGLKDQLNERRGALGWGEAYILQGYVMMLEAYQDTHYADKLVDHIDHVLATRDSVRGVSAYPGRSMPVWRSTGPYNVGEVVLPGADLRPVLRLRTAGGFAETITAAVTHTGTDTFDLRVTRDESEYQTRRAELEASMMPPDPLQVRTVAAGPQAQTYTGLRLDPDRDGDAVRRINDDFTADGLRITAQAVPGAAAGSARGGLPKEGRYRFASLPYVHSVQTGMIVWPMVRFARVTLRNRYLEKYRAKARGYLAAAQAALQAHDGELRHDHATGRSWYAAPKGSPFVIDGSDQPLNYTAAMARAWRELALTTRSPSQRTLAQALTRCVTRDFRATDGDELVWGYYRSDGRAHNGWKPGDGISQHWPRFAAASYPEDVSHGHLEVDMVVRAHRLDDLEDTEVLPGLSRTFTTRLTSRKDDGTPVVHTRVDGVGVAPRGRAVMVAGWLGAADHDRSIAGFVQDVFAQMNPAPSAQSIYGCAYLNWRARGL